MARTLEGKVVVITGASSGIGRATALELARHRAKLVLAARRVAPLESAVRECERLGASALAVPTDVTDADAMARLADRAVEHFGRIDGWVNNAGVYLMGDFENTPDEVFRRVIETNFEGAVNGVRAVLPHLRRRGGGAIVNTSSVYGAITGPYLTAYCASKHAVRGFTASLRQELHGAGIRVSTVLPEAVDTPMWRHSANYSGQEIRPMIPVIRPELVANAVVRALQGPGREVHAGMGGRVFSALRALLPRLFDPTMRIAASRLHFSRHPAFDSPGNLFAPIESGTEISGGYRPKAWTWVPRAAALGLLGAGLIGWAASRKRAQRSAFRGLLN